MTNTKKTWLLNPWLVCFSAALFFYYEFIQMNMLNAMSMAVMQSFNINATLFGQLSAFYFYSNIIFLLPAGQILDRFSTRKIILISLSLCVLGTFGFALAPNFHLALIARFFTGIGSAFCFLSCVRLATRWFQPKQLALVIGLIVTMAMLGGMTAQTPLVILVEHLGWRQAVFIDACLGVAILLLIFFVVRDYPPELKEQQQQQRQQLHQLGYWQSMRQSYLGLQNWLAGIYTSMMNLPIFVLGGFLGNQYLITVRHLSYTEASLVSAMLFLGTTVGSPVMGWISDRMGYRRRPMIIGSILSLAFILMIMFYASLGYVSLLILFLSLGFITSTQVISYPVVAESNSALITTTSISVISFCAIAGGAIFNPVFGKLIDWHTRISGSVPPHYSQSDFQFAMWLFPLVFGVAFIAAIILRETFCQRQ